MRADRSPSPAHRTVFNAVANYRVAFNLSMRTHTDQFRYVHETVFEDGFRDEARAFGHRFNSVNCACISVGNAGCGAVRTLTALGRCPCISGLIQSSPISMSAPASRSFASTASGYPAGRYGRQSYRQKWPRPPGKCRFRYGLAVRDTPPPRRSTPSMVIRSVPCPLIFAPSATGSLQYPQSPVHARRFR